MEPEINKFATTPILNVDWGIWIGDFCRELQEFTIINRSLPLPHFDTDCRLQFKAKRLIFGE